MDMPAVPLPIGTPLIYADPDEDPPHFPAASRVFVTCDCREGGCIVEGRLVDDTVDRELCAWEAFERALEKEDA